MAHISLISSHRWYAFAAPWRCQFLPWDAQSAPRRECASSYHPIKKAPTTLFPLPSPLPPTSHPLFPLPPPLTSSSPPPSPAFPPNGNPSFDSARLGSAPRSGKRKELSDVMPGDGVAGHPGPSYPTPLHPPFPPHGSRGPSVRYGPWKTLSSYLPRAPHHPRPRT